MKPLAAILACALASASLHASDPLYVRVAKALTMRGRPVDHAVIAIEGGKIVRIGKDVPIPVGARVLDHSSSWACPGFIDLHSHIWSEGDINEMGHPLNPELRTLDALVLWSDAMRRASASGVTTVLSISGSGTNFSSFGTLLKVKPVRRLEDAIVMQPGAMKVAQDWNPERRGGDLGASRMGMSYGMRWMNDRALAHAAAVRAGGPGDKELDNLAALLEGEIPVLIHTASARGVMNTVRMWHDEYPTRMVLSHGCFDGWRGAAYAAARDVAINNGPRMFEFSRVDGRMHGICAEFARAGVRRLSVNTDSPVVPQHELAFQASMAAWLGLPDYDALEALTYWPAEALGVDHRLGSLEPGKDADLVITSGSPLDVRAAVELVIVDGEIVFDRRRDGERP
ncbi:MAG: amidohydrolase family protein [Planctomycetes bacterium]|nr:amidohydrolase family protein [Planctomycetota bacterium]